MNMKQGKRNQDTYSRTQLSTHEYRNQKVGTKKVTSLKQKHENHGGKKKHKSKPRNMDKCNIETGNQVQQQNNWIQRTEARTNKTH